MDQLTKIVVDYIPERWRSEEFAMYAIIASIILTLLNIIVIWYLNSSKTGKKVLVVGISESGKTSLFSQLTSGKHVNTLTSMTPNEAHLQFDRRSVLLVDIPGFERLRAKCFEDSKGGLLAILYVIDSAAFTNNIRDVADYFYSVLTDSHVYSSRVPIAVLCNKQDLPKSKSPKVIKSMLEKELHTVRETRVAALGSTGSESESDNAVLGQLSKEFSFNDVRNKVEFLSCTAGAGGADSSEDAEPDISEIFNWLNKII